MLVDPANQARCRDPFLRFPGSDRATRIDLTAGLCGDGDQPGASCEKFLSSPPGIGGSSAPPLDDKRMPVESGQTNIVRRSAPIHPRESDTALLVPPAPTSPAYRHPATRLFRYRSPA